jgi:hypothetical protein
MTNNLVAPTYLGARKHLRANLVQRSPVHRTMIWISMGCIGTAVVLAVVHLLKCKTLRNGS